MEAVASASRRALTGSSLFPGDLLPLAGDFRQLGRGRRRAADAGGFRQRGIEMSIGTALGLTGVAAGLASAGVIGGGLSAAGGLASSLIGSSAAKSAASEQEQASQNAIAEQQREFNTTQHELRAVARRWRRRAFAADLGHRAGWLARHAIRRDVPDARAVRRANGRGRIERPRLCVPSRAGRPGDSAGRGGLWRGVLGRNAEGAFALRAGLRVERIPERLQSRATGLQHEREHGPERVQYAVQRL